MLKLDLKKVEEPEIQLPKFVGSWESKGIQEKVYTSVSLTILKPLWWHPTPVLLPGKSRGRRSPVGCSPWGCEESDTMEQLHSHFSLSCIGKGNGNPLQCPCLDNPRDGGAWWAAIYGVPQSRTWLKWLSSSSSSSDRLTWNHLSMPIVDTSTRKQILTHSESGSNL